MFTGERAAHLRVLDGIRGVAIILVVVPHLELAGGIAAPAIVGRIVEMFGHGVDIFFVLSGFCLALPILTALHAGRSASLHLPTFYFNRFFRIAPMYYAATALCTIFALGYVAVGHRVPPGMALPHSLWDAFAPLLFMDRAAELVNPSFWSIAVQLRWYLAFPFLMALYAFSRRLFCILMVGAWLAYLATRLHALDLGTLPLFMLGILAADLHLRQHPWRRYALWLLPLAIGLGHLGDRWASAPDEFGNELHWTMQPTTLGWQLAAFLFVVAATENGLLARILRSPPLVALGVASFSIYLVHEPAILGALLLFGPHAGLAAMAVALGAGALLWLGLERPLAAPALRRRLRAACVPQLERVLHASELEGDVRFALPRAREPQLGPARA
jgi:peptidoglycan/LPS O-acetylase OafA/YrhL